MARPRELALHRQRLEAGHLAGRAGSRRAAAPERPTPPLELEESPPLGREGSLPEKAAIGRIGRENAEPDPEDDERNLHRLHDARA